MANDYETNKPYYARYYERCTKVQVMLNPENERDARIIAYLAETGGGRPLAGQIKDLLAKYIDMEAAIKKAGFGD